MLWEMNLKSSLSRERVVGTSKGFVLAETFCALSLTENEFKEFVSEIELLMSLMKSDP
jgi:hypothetical protein